MRILCQQEPSHATTLAGLIDRFATIPAEVTARVETILADVRKRGDAALIEWTQQLDRRTLAEIEVPLDERRRLAAEVAPGVAEAIALAARRIERFHAAWKETGFSLTEPGIKLGLRLHPLRRVGLYVPGGTARYPSTVLMTAIPARVAGVSELIMTTPGPSPETMLAAEVAGVDRVFAIGGAQAIGALAYGTASVPAVDKIVGPGNLYVAAAKRLVYGMVDIDAFAGPSEVLLLADQTANPRFLAADLLAQAEHDAEAYAVLVTTSQPLAEAVAAEVAAQVATLARREIAEKALAHHGAIVVCPDLTAAITFANQFAPEHLGLVVASPNQVLPHLTTAGACFVGEFSAEAVGDYLAGPNHVLPTGGTARYRSPLGCWDFLRRSTVIEYDRTALAAHAPAITALASAEGLGAHAEAIRLRLASSPGPGCATNEGQTAPSTPSALDRVGERKATS